MISSITLQNVASYENSTLTTNKKVNLIYGLNGTGKSTLSNYLYNRKDGKYTNCSILPPLNDDDEILVYNQKFVEDNLFSDLNGIFTLSTENKQAESEINNIQEQLENLKKNKESQTQEKDTQISNITTAHNKEKERLEDKFWESTKAYKDNHALSFCLPHKNNKGKLYKILIDKEFKQDTKPEITIPELEEKWLSISDKEVQLITPLSEISFSSEIEQNDLFSKQIVGNDNSSVSDLIKTLSNADWVQNGLKYLRDDHNCPFCQQSTITDNFKASLSDYFAGVYDKDLQKLKELSHAYQKSIEQIPKKEDFEKNSKYASYKDKFESKYQQLQTIILKNQNKIKEKIQSPSTSLTLENSEQALSELNEVIGSINKKIGEHNLNLKKKEQVEKEIIRDFRAIIHCEHSDDIERHNEFLKLKTEELQSAQESKKDNLDGINAEIQTKKTELEAWQKKTVNLDEAIKNINADLQNLGILDFKLEKTENDKYKITRGENHEDTFKSLSEGEKMMISFLYFIELCKGKKEPKGTTKNKIIVIDDPISSLSHIYIFNVAQYIKHTFANPKNKLKYEQIFVLTHSLYFFTELQKITTGEWASKKEIPTKKYYRLTKDQYNKSDFRDLKTNEIQNNYQEYWSIVKDDNSPKALVANCMRHIIEHFFGFLGNDNGLSEIENSISDEKFGAFFRYMNRASHSDLINHDANEIDVQLWKSYFFQLFNTGGYIEHYKKMME